MGKMQHPDLKLRSNSEWSLHFGNILNNLSIKSVSINESTPLPEDGGKHGGITHVPYISIRCRGQGRMRIHSGGKERELMLESGSAVLHMPGTFARTEHLSPGYFLRFTCDTDHVLCGIARCLDPQKLDDPRGFPPLDACILPRCDQEPGPELFSLISRSPETAQSSRIAWLNAWLWHLHHELQTNTAGGPAPQWLAMRNWLEEHCGEDISRSDCAASFGIHPNHLARLFKQHARCSFTESLLKLRMKKARLLLTQRRLAIQQIAIACGFQDSAYFIRRFREQHGQSPARWRKQQ